MRSLVTLITAGVLFGTLALGCEEKTPEDVEMTQPRTPPAEQRPAPGSDLGGPGSSETGDGNKPSPPPP